jgi:hypothetical protein
MVHIGLSLAALAAALALTATRRIRARR